jgi:peptidyl-prolyl cis-trans isomerase SurA
MTRFLSSRILVAALSGLPAAILGAQQPAPAAPPAATSGPVALDAIVAVVGDQPITRFDLREAFLAKIQRGEIKQPTDSVQAAALEHDVLDDLVQDELLIQKAKDLKIEVLDAEITPDVDRQVRETRARFPTEAEFRTALTQASLGTPEEYRRFLMDQFRRQMTRQKVLRKLTQDGKIIPVNVTDAEISAEFEKAKEFIPKKPATVTFKQIVISPQASAAAREAARLKAEAVLAELRSGADFEKIAKRESMDPLTKETGGDIGWARRGENLPEFDRWLFGSSFVAALVPGQLSPVVELPLGFYIIRVDRVQPGEVKAHQIVIVPKVDSGDVARARVLADSVAKLWGTGVPFDTLAKKYHDYAGKEETSILTPWVRDSLPVSYQNGFQGHKPPDIVSFQIPGSSQRPDVPKFVVAQLLTAQEAGDRTLDEMRSAVRSELSQRGGVRRYIDSLKKQTYVAVHLPAPAAASGGKPNP